MERAIRKFIKEQTRRRYTKFWGQKQIIEPTVLSKQYGDGLQIIHITPLDTRPNYYIVRVDSKLDIKDDHFSNVILENILNSIEEEFDCIDNFQQDFNSKGDYVVRRYFPEKGERWRSYDKITKFPMLHWSGGSWGTLKNFGITK